MIPLRKMTPEEYAEVNLIGTERVPNRGVEGNQALVQALGDKLREIVDENAEVQNENNENIYTKAEVDNKDLTTLDSARRYTDQKVIDIGGADMTKAIYDPEGRNTDIFKYVESVSYFVVLSADGWNDSAPYTQTIMVEGLTETYKSFADIILSEDVDIARNELGAWGFVSRIDIGTDNITATCFDNVPEIDLSFELRVVK